MSRRDGVMGLLIAVVIVVALGYMIGMQSWSFLPSASAAGNLFTLLPGLMVVFFGLASMGASGRSPAVIGSGTFTGIGFALLLSELDAEGILVAGSFGMWTLYNLQMVCIVLGILFGAVLYFRR